MIPWSPSINGSRGVEKCWVTLSSLVIEVSGAVLFESPGVPVEVYEARQPAKPAQYFAH